MAKKIDITVLQLLLLKKINNDSYDYDKSKEHQLENRNKETWIIKFLIITFSKETILEIIERNSNSNLGAILKELKLKEIDNELEIKKNFFINIESNILNQEE